MDLDPRPAAPALPALLLGDAALDHILTAQLAVAWAGEGGEAPRLGWWKTFMVHEDGGLALFEEIAPATHRWVVFQGAREAARRADAALRARDHDPDRLYTLFRFGFELDERLDERLLDHKRAGRDPFVALPGLNELCTARWDAAHFADWVAGHGTVNVVGTPAGRRLTGDRPADVERQARNLVAALHPASPSYPLPHYKVG
jgi:hypothetical protein